MTIDIIDLTDEKYDELTEVQMVMVREAQRKKDAVLADAAQRKDAYYARLVENGTAHNTFYALTAARVDGEAEEEIEAIKEDLLYQLESEALGDEGNENGPYRYPENPNYNLSSSQRFLAVREYYMQTYPDPEARLEAFYQDILAREYLGAFYLTLYDLFAAYLL